MSTHHPSYRPRIGLALGSGAARGWAHIGVIEALRDAGIEPDIVCGTSMGALVGGACVAGKLSALKDFAVGLTWRKIVDLLDIRLSGGGILDGSRIVTWLQDLGVTGPIQSHAKPFAAVATDLETGREIWLREGPIDDAVRASISLPGIFKPSRIDGRWLADGGMVNPVPVSVCRALGADIIIAVNLNGDIVGRLVDEDGRRVKTHPVRPSPEFLRRLVDQIPPALRPQASAIAPKLLRTGPTTPGYFDVLTNSINVMQDQITRARLAGEPPHVLLMPRLRDIALLEFNRAGEAIAEGRACAENALGTIRRLLEDQPPPA